MQATARQRIPFWRNVRYIAILSQVIFVIVIALIGAFLYANLTSALHRKGLASGFDFLGIEAGFGIGESLIPYSPSDTYGRAFLVGLLNTLYVSFLGIIFATILGVFVGVIRLSSNWLVRNLARAYIEVTRNTPLLVQLFFVYFGLMMQAPPVKQSLSLPGHIYINRRGVFIPAPKPGAGFSVWTKVLAIGALAAIGLWIYLKIKLQRTGRGAPPFLSGLGLFVAVALVGYVALGGPVNWQAPVLKGFNFVGGTKLSPEFFSLLMGLVVYTAAFIAEVVRAGIQAVPKGQLEAARALGLSEIQVLRLVIFPQALRVIVPPLTSQYLNLAKNSSLAVAIGYPDLYSVAGTIYNQTGRPLPVIILMMGSYLAMSLTTSLFMNIYNRRIQYLLK